MLEFYLLLFLVGFMFTVASFFLGQFGGGSGGADSVDGLDGIDGVDGLDGIDGIDAVDGVDGIDGVGGIDSPETTDLIPETPFVSNLIWTLLPLRPTSFILFITTFGGIGFILTKLDFGFVKALVVSFMSGYALATLLNVLLGTLKRMQNTSTTLRSEAVGRAGEVIGAIAENGFGRVRYQIKDEVFSAPARHVKGHALPQNAKVIIRAVQGTVLFVDERPL